jgi:GDP-4-dehydro-6-deoxy-D-mannose reductase
LAEVGTSAACRRSPSTRGAGEKPFAAEGAFMPHSILVTGAAGFAGSHLVELLAAERARDPSRDADIIGWHRPGKTPPAMDGVTWEPVDLLDGSAVAIAIARHLPSKVYHCAGAAHVGRAWDSVTATFAVNVKGTHHLFEALRTAALSPIVLVPSSAMIYRPSSEPIAEDQDLVPPNPYGLSKLAQEALALRGLTDGIDVRVGRAFNHVGPRQDPAFAASGFARQIAEIEAGRHEARIVVGNLSAEREATDVRDTVRAYHAIVERGTSGRPYNVTSGRGYAVGEILARLVDRARVPVHVRVDVTRYRPNDLPRLVGDPSRIRNEIGWMPTIPLERTLDDMLAYWRSQM